MAIGYSCGLTNYMTSRYLKFYFKLISAFLAVVFILTPPVPPRVCAEEKNFLPAKKNLFKTLSEIELPNETGKIQEFFRGEKNGRAVVLVQDAHAIADGQRNIQKIIDYFQTEYQIRTTAVEGASEKLDAGILRSFPDHSALEKALESYTEKGELSGAAAAAILNKSPGEFIGVEDWSLYQEGLDLYRQALERQKEILPRIYKLQTRLNKQKQTVFSPRLLAVDRALTEFEKGETDFSRVMLLLAQENEPRPDSALASVLKEIRRDEKDSVQIQAEVKSEAERILKSGPAPAVFHDKYQAFQTSRLSAVEFAVFLETYHARFSPELRESLRNHRKIQAIEGTDFFREFKIYSNTVKRRLLKTPEEKEADRKSRGLRLCEKLAKLELSRDEWIQLKARNLPALAGSLRVFSEFYRNAEKRDGVFFEKIQRLMTDQHPEIMMIAGGFHSQELMRLFRQAGISYLLVTPEIHDLSGQAAYLAQMNREVSWKNYFHPENGRIFLYPAFIRSVRDRLLESGDLKEWRDQLIRDLIAQERVSEAWSYTRFLDEVLKPEEKKISRYPWQEKISRFLEGLRGLESSGKLTESNIAALLKPVNIVTETGGPAVLQLSAWMNQEVPARRARSEVRAAGSDREEAVKKVKLLPESPENFRARAWKGLKLAALYLSAVFVLILLNQIVIHFFLSNISRVLVGVDLPEQVPEAQRAYEGMAHNHPDGLKILVQGTEENRNTPRNFIFHFVADQGRLSRVLYTGPGSWLAVYLGFRIGSAVIRKLKMALFNWYYKPQAAFRFSFIAKAERIFQRIFTAGLLIYFSGVLMNVVDAFLFHGVADYIPLTNHYLVSPGDLLIWGGLGLMGLSVTVVLLVTIFETFQYRSPETSGNFETHGRSELRSETELTEDETPADPETLEGNIKEILRRMALWNSLLGGEFSIFVPPVEVFGQSAAEAVSSLEALRASGHLFDRSPVKVKSRSSGVSTEWTFVVWVKRRFKQQVTEYLKKSNPTADQVGRMELLLERIASVPEARSEVRAETSPVEKEEDLRRALELYPLMSAQIKTYGLYHLIETGTYAWSPARDIFGLDIEDEYELTIQGVPGEEAEWGECTVGSCVSARVLNAHGIKASVHRIKIPNRFSFRPVETGDLLDVSSWETLEDRLRGLPRSPSPVDYEMELQHAVARTEKGTIVDASGYYRTYAPEQIPIWPEDIHPASKAVRSGYRIESYRKKDFTVNSMGFPLSKNEPGVWPPTVAYQPLKQRNLPEKDGRQLTVTTQVGVSSLGHQFIFSLAGLYRIFDPATQAVLTPQSFFIFWTVPMEQFPVEKRAQIQSLLASGDTEEMLRFFLNPANGAQVLINDNVNVSDGSLPAEWDRLPEILKAVREDTPYFLTFISKVPKPPYKPASAFIFEPRPPIQNEEISAVYVRGDFNGWASPGFPMTFEDGVWRASIPVKAVDGGYKYYVVFKDGSDRWVSYQNDIFNPMVNKGTSDNHRLFSYGNSLKEHLFKNVEPGKLKKTAGELTNLILDFQDKGFTLYGLAAGSTEGLNPEAFSVEFGQLILVNREGVKKINEPGFKGYDPAFLKEVVLSLIRREDTELPYDTNEIDEGIREALSARGRSELRAVTFPKSIGTVEIKSWMEQNGVFPDSTALAGFYRLVNRLEPVRDNEVPDPRTALLLRQLKNSWVSREVAAQNGRTDINTARPLARGLDAASFMRVIAPNIQGPGMSNDELSVQYWKMHWETLDASQTERQGSWGNHYPTALLEFLYQRLDRLLPARAGEKPKVLDLGAGDLYVTRKLAERRRDLDLTALDPVVPKEPVQGITFKQASAENTGFADHSMDAVISMYALDYTDKERSVEELKRIMKSGKAVLQLHHPQSQVTVNDRSALMLDYRMLDIYHELISMVHAGSFQGLAGVRRKMAALPRDPYALGGQEKYIEHVERMIALLQTPAAGQAIGAIYGDTLRIYLDIYNLEKFLAGLFTTADEVKAFFRRHGLAAEVTVFYDSKGAPIAYGVVLGGETQSESEAVPESLFPAISDKEAGLLRWVYELNNLSLSEILRLRVPENDLRNLKTILQENLKMVQTDPELAHRRAGARDFLEEMFAGYLADLESLIAKQKPQSPQAVDLKSFSPQAEAARELAKKMRGLISRGISDQEDDLIDWSTISEKLLKIAALPLDQGQIKAGAADLLKKGKRVVPQKRDLLVAKLTSILYKAKQESARSEVRAVPAHFDLEVNKAAAVILTFIKKLPETYVRQNRIFSSNQNEVETITLKNFVRTYWDEITEILGDTPSLWPAQLKNFGQENSPTERFLRLLVPAWQSMGRFGRYSGSEALREPDYLGDFRRETRLRAPGKRKERQAFRAFVGGPGFFQEPIEVLSALERFKGIEAKVLVAGLGGQASLMEKFMANEIYYDPQDIREARLSGIPTAKYFDKTPRGYRLKPEKHALFQLAVLNFNQRESVQALGLEKLHPDFIFFRQVFQYLEESSRGFLMDTFLKALDDNGILYSSFPAMHFPFSMTRPPGTPSLRLERQWMEGVIYPSGDGTKPELASAKYHKKGYVIPGREKWGNNPYKNREKEARLREEFSILAQTLKAYSGKLPEEIKSAEDIDEIAGWNIGEYIDGFDILRGALQAVTVTPEFRTWLTGRPQEEQYFFYKQGTLYGFYDLADVPDWAVSRMDQESFFTTPRSEVRDLLVKPWVDMIAKAEKNITGLEKLWNQTFSEESPERAAELRRIYGTADKNELFAYWRGRFEKMKQVKTKEDLIRFVEEENKLFAAEPDANLREAIAKIDAAGELAVPDRTFYFRMPGDRDPENLSVLPVSATGYWIDPILKALELSETPFGFMQQIKLPEGEILTFVHLWIREDFETLNMARTYAHERYHIEQADGFAEALGEITQNGLLWILREGTTEYLATDFIRRHFGVLLPFKNQFFINEIFSKIGAQAGRDAVYRFHTSGNPEFLRQGGFDPDRLRLFQEYTNGLEPIRRQVNLLHLMKAFKPHMNLVNDFFDGTRDANDALHALKKAVPVWGRSEARVENVSFRLFSELGPDEIRGPVDWLLRRMWSDELYTRWNGKKEDALILFRKDFPEGFEVTDEQRFRGFPLAAYAYQVNSGSNRAFGNGIYVFDAGAGEDLRRKKYGSILRDELFTRLKLKVQYLVIGSSSLGGIHKDIGAQNFQRRMLQENPRAVTRIAFYPSDEGPVYEPTAIYTISSPEELENALLRHSAQKIRMIEVNLDNYQPASRSEVRAKKISEKQQLLNEIDAAEQLLNDSTLGSQDKFFIRDYLAQARVFLRANKKRQAAGPVHEAFAAHPQSSIQSIQKSRVAFEALDKRFKKFIPRKKTGPNPKTDKPARSEVRLPGIRSYSGALRIARQAPVRKFSEAFPEDFRTGFYYRGVYGKEVLEDWINSGKVKNIGRAPTRWTADLSEAHLHTYTDSPYGENYLSKTLGVLLEIPEAVMRKYRKSTDINWHDLKQFPLSEVSRVWLVYADTEKDLKEDKARIIQVEIRPQSSKADTPRSELRLAAENLVNAFRTNSPGSLDIPGIVRAAAGNLDAFIPEVQAAVESEALKEDAEILKAGMEYAEAIRAVDKPVYVRYQISEQDLAQLGGKAEEALRALLQAAHDAVSINKNIVIQVKVPQRVRDLLKVADHNKRDILEIEKAGGSVSFYHQSMQGRLDQSPDLVIGSVPENIRMLLSDRYGDGQELDYGAKDGENLPARVLTAGLVALSKKTVDFLAQVDGREDRERVKSAEALSAMAAAIQELSRYRMQALRTAASA